VVGSARVYNKSQKGDMELWQAVILR
jgi:hypothetical protein